MEKGTKKVKAADPKKKAVKRALTGKEAGDSGTSIFSGIVQEEYRSELINEKGVKVYDEMRKSDGTVRAATLVTQLPIRRASWFIKEASDSPKDKEVAELVRKNLFEWLDMPWDDFLRQALLMLPFGVMPFEKVYGLKDWEGKSYVIWQKLAPRLPKSIQSWELSNREAGIQQIRQDGVVAEIPMDKLLLFINEREGDNYWGTSILRAAYKHWYMKNNFYKIDAIAFERQGLGVPYAKLPNSAAEEDETRAKKILQNMRANENAYVVVPDGYEIGFLDMGAKNTRDPKESIAHHNREITKAVLAQFLELGATETGSRALSSDQSELFLKSLEAIANNIVDVFNKHAIPQLVDFNYDGIENYPQLDYSDISKADVEKLSNAYKTLIEAGGIKYNEADEQYFRGLLGLPEVTEEEEQRREEDVTEDTAKDLGLDEELKKEKKREPANAHEIAVKIKKRVEGMTTSNAIRYLRESINNVTVAAHTSEFYREVKGALTARLKEHERKIFQENNDFKGWRPLTFAEKKVNFKSIQDTLDKVEQSFITEATGLLETEKERYIKQVSGAILKEDTEAIKNATFNVRGAYNKVVSKHLRQIYEFGKNNAAREIGEEAPSNNPETIRQLDLTTDAIVDGHLTQLTTKAKTAIVEAIRKPEDKADFAENKTRAIGALGAVLTKAIDGLVRDSAAIVMAGFLNYGRNDVFTAYEDKIYALQRSEILDVATCNYCLSIDGRIIEKNDPFGSNTIFHSNCRGIWVEILEDEEEKPTIDGIPSSLKDRFGDSVNALLQPKNPIVKKTSLAKKEVERRERRANK